MRTFGVVSLGCDKNRVDTENLIAYMIEGGYVLTQDPKEAEVIIVNTCGFIKPAIEESIDTILEMSDYKSEKCKFLVVTGCMSQRFMDDIKDEFSEVDLFLGTMSYHKIAKLVDDMYQDRRIRFVKNDINDREFTSKRYLSTPPHYAYLKIAEGCSNHCTYCAIPSIRGKYTSRKIEDLLEETKTLCSSTLLKELIVVAQDVTKYGLDIYNEISIIKLINELDKIEIPWIRLLYCYPELVTEDFVKAIVSSKHIVHYLDIPLQHVSDSVLKRMARRIRYNEIISMIEMIRRYDTQFVIRSTFIVGFPGETEEDHKMLLDFLKKYKLDRVGFFIYSPEEGTPAYKFKDQIPVKIKERRYKELYDVQQQIMHDKQKDKIGNIYDVVYEGIDYDSEMFYGRDKFNAPDIDSFIYFTADDCLEIGEIYKVKIKGLKELDLIGEVVYD